MYYSHIWILKGKVALVTGSSSGIGRSIALALAEEGCVVIINSRKNVKGGYELMNELVDRSGKAIYVQGDLSKPDEAERLFETIVNKFKSLDILINNAGESKGGDFEDIELWRYQFENILLSQVISTSKFLKLKSKGLRKIVNISSIYGSELGGKENYVAYSAFKAGVNSMTVNLAKNLKGDVLVNAIAPGWTWTPAWG